MASYPGSGQKRKQPETPASQTNYKQPKVVVNEGSIASAPVRYNIPKETKIIPQTPINPTPVNSMPETNFIPMSVPRPYGSQAAGISYQQALQKVDGKKNMSYVFPHLAPNKGQIQTTDPFAKKIYRKAGGEVWEDSTLLEWNPEDHRIFVGDLGNEVNDDQLFKAFMSYPSILKAKVIRDKRSGKSKGFGFVSFGEPTDMVNALKETNGKYIGNRPCKLRKSRWKDRELCEEAAPKNHRGRPK